MPVETPHPAYTYHAPDWLKCRHVVEGERAVKQAGETYLPKLAGQNETEYRAYKMRAEFYGATHRTVGGLAGSVMRKPPTTTYGDEEFLKQLGGVGTDEKLLAKRTVEEVLTTGRAGLYVDAPAVPEGSLVNVEPYVCLYYAENIINWREDTRDGKTVLTLVVLKEEEHRIDPKDPFKMEVVPRYRVLRLDDGALFVDVWTKKREGAKPTPGVMTDYELLEENKFMPKMRGGKPIDFIPFTFVTPRSVNCAIEKSPVLDLAEINLSHYRTSADLEHGRHFTALPVAWAAGFDTQKGVLQIGSAVAWVSDAPEARAGYLEFTGAGLASLVEGMSSKEKRMAVLGARLLEQEKKDVEAAETVKLRHAGENSLLAGIAQTVSDALTNVLTWVAAWRGDGGESKMELNKDFIPEGMDPTFLAQITAAMQSGAISYDVFYHLCEKHEMYPDGWTIDKEKAAIADGGPMPAPGKPLNGGLAPDPELKQAGEELDLAAKEQQLEQAAAGAAA